MEPKKTPSKTALFILVNLMFCIEFAQGFFDTELLKAHDLPIDYDLRHEIAEKIHEFQQEIGDGTCSKERVSTTRDKEQSRIYCWNQHGINYSAPGYYFLARLFGGSSNGIFSNTRPLRPTFY